MRVATFAICLLATLPAAAEPVQAAGDYRTCPAEISEEGRGLVAKSCGTLAVPDFSGVEFQSAGEMEDARYQSTKPGWSPRGAEQSIKSY